MNNANFEITLHRQDSDSYSVVLRCTLPDNDTDVSRSGTARFDLDQLRALSLDCLSYARLLTSSLFKDPVVAAAFTEARAAAQALGTRLQVHLGVESDAPELHSLHWEILLDPRDGSYLFSGEQVIFSRYLSSLDWQPVRLRPKNQLTALVVISNPANLAEFGLAPVDVQGESTRAQTNLHGIGVTTLASGGTATLNNLSDHLREGGHDILYFVCHGSIVDNEPWLWMEDEAGNVARVSGAALVAGLKDLQYRPRLVVLASCQSAGVGGANNPTAHSALVSLGPRLVGAGIPAVLAMQGSVSMETVADFMPVFFRELLRDGQIDRAMAVARGAISNRPDFWMPVLFMRLKSGLIWDPAMADQRKDPPVPSMPAPEPRPGRKRVIGLIAGVCALLAIAAGSWITLRPKAPVVPPNSLARANQPAAQRGSNAASVPKQQPPLAPAPPLYFADSRELPGAIHKLQGGAVTEVYRRPSGNLSSVAVSPTGEIFFCNANDRRVYKIENGQEKSVYTHNTYVRSVAFDSHGVLYFSEATGGGGDGTIYRLNGSTAVPFHSVRLSEIDGYWAGDFAFDRQGTLWLSSGNRRPANLYKLVNGSLTLVLASADPIDGISFAHDGSLLYTRQSFIYQVTLPSLKTFLLYQSPKSPANTWLTGVAPLPQ
jgi:WD40 repeat protein